MTKEELKLEALKYLENFKDCANCKHRWGDCADELDEDCLINNCYSATPKEQDIYLAGAEPREKRIAELEAQIEKMKGIIFDLLWFEDNLDPYMYDCNDAQKGNLLKPFDNAKDILKDCICKKCKGTGEVRVGYNGWITNPCPSCEGRGYIVKEIKEK